MRVALDLPFRGDAEDFFDYRWVIQGENLPQVGQRVIVPLGKHTAIGLLVGMSESSTVASSKLRDGIAVLADLEPLSQEWIALIAFAANYYHRSFGEVALPALPTLLRRASGYKFDEEDGVGGPPGPRYSSLSMRLLENKYARFLKAQTPASSRHAAIETLPTLTAQQAEVMAQFQAQLQNERGFQATLLHGITGSGKTEIYLRLIAQILTQGNQILVLAPEINLTPQLERVIRQRFPDAHISSMHSGMADGERALHWLLGQRGWADILIGTRMAVLAPLPRLKLIIVDEEHDASFKQQEGLRYSGRDMAVMRAKQLGIPIVLGSATPSLESWLQAQRGRYKKLALTSRAVETAVLPHIQRIDLARTQVEHGFSEELREAIAKRLHLGEQTLIFLNRRGYAPVLSCTSCGWVSQCKRCSVSAVFHKNDRCLHCHHCGWQIKVPRQCPDCGNADLAPLGRGTQRIEENLALWFPEARIVRIDRDSTQKKGSMQTLLNAIHSGEVDILVGTQMIAKGHDFKNLTLVGVIDADSALFSHDFRAAERLFSGLMQVAGRAGRADKPGEVLIQTRYPQHPLFAALVAHDFVRFVESQLAERRVNGLPPYSHQAVLRAEAKTVAAALDFLREAKALGAALIERLSNTTLAAIDLYDPVPMNLMRLANAERAQLVIESPSRQALQAFLTAWLNDLRNRSSRVRWHIEVDPLEI